MKGIGVRIASALASWSVRRAGWVVLVALVLSVLSAWATMNLDIVTDLKRLLPEDYPSVTRLDDLLARAGNQSDIVVTVESPDPAANVRWGARFAALMEKEESIRFVQFARPLGALEQSALLYLELPEIEEIRQRVIARIQREVRDELDMGLDDEDDEGGAASPPVAAPAGAVARALDDFEDDEDFGGKGKPVAQALDDFEDDEDFGGEPKPAAPAAAGSADESEEESLDIDDLKRKYGVEDLPEHYTNEDGTLLVVRARPKAGTGDTRVCQRLVDMTRAHIAAAAAPDDPPEMVITLKGHHLERTEEVRSLQGNMAVSAAACLGLLLLVIGLYFRRKRAVTLIAVPLVMSVLWSLGVAFLVYGYLNIISAFIFAVLLGLGIDFGIHVLSRYDEARREGHDNATGLHVALTTTGLSAATGGLTTAAVFFLLTLGDFQGFSQFGFVAGCGVLISLLAVFTVMPALVTLFERRKPWRSRESGPARGLPRWLPDPARRPALVIAFVVFGASLLAAGEAATHLDSVEFEYAFDKLGSRSKLRAAEEKARQDPEAYKDVIGRHAMGAPTIVMAERTEQAEALYRQFDAMIALPESLKAALAAAPNAAAVGEHPQIRALLERLAPEDEERRAIERGLLEIERLGDLYPIERLRTMVDRLNEVVSIHRYVPAEQPAKLVVIEDIRRRLEQKRAAFAPEDRKRIDELMGYLRPATLTVESLPEWLRVQFREPEGAEGRFLVLRTKGSKSDILNTSDLKRAFFDVRVGDEEIPSAATYFVLPEIMETIAEEGPLLIGLALATLLLILLAFFRSAKALLFTLIPLCFSVLWVGGALAVFGVKLNFYNIVVIPLLLGMGIDHGVHIYSRFREHGGQDLALVLRETGAAIGMATLTTMIGFAGLFFADHVGLNSMGTLAILGMGLAFLGAVATLPALLHLDRRRR